MCVCVGERAFELFSSFAITSFSHIPNPIQMEINKVNVFPFQYSWAGEELSIRISQNSHFLCSFASIEHKRQLYFRLCSISIAIDYFMGEVDAVNFKPIFIVRT